MTTTSYVVYMVQYRSYDTKYTTTYFYTYVLYHIVRYHHHASECVIVQYHTPTTSYNAITLPTSRHAVIVHPRPPASHIRRSTRFEWPASSSQSLRPPSHYFWICAMGDGRSAIGDGRSAWHDSLRGKLTFDVPDNRENMMGEPSRPRQRRRRRRSRMTARTHNHKPQHNNQPKS